MAELKFEVLFAALDRLSPTLTKISKGFQGVRDNLAATKPMREMGETMMKAGAVAVGIGAAGVYGLSKFVVAAAAMQGEMAHVATAMDDGAKQQQHLNEVQEQAQKLAQQGVIGEVQLAQAYYTARMNTLSHTDALKAMATAAQLVTATTTNAAEAQASMDATTRTLTGLMIAFHKPLNEISDSLTILQSREAFRNIGELNDAFTYAIPAAKTAGVSFQQMNAALAMLSVGFLHGAETGSGFQEFVSKLSTGGKLRAFAVTNAKGGLDVVASIQRFAEAFKSMPAVERAFQLHELGFGERDIRGLSIMIDKAHELQRVVTEQQKAQGATAQLAKLRAAALDEQWARLGNTWDVLKSKLGETLLPAITSVVTGLAGVLTHFANFAQAHPVLTKTAMWIAAIGSALLVATGAMVALGGAILIGSSFASAFGLSMTFALMGLPLIIAGIAAAIFALIHYWAQVKSFMVSFGGWVKRWGLTILEFIVAPWAMIPAEIYKHWGAIKNAAMSIAHGIARFFVGHSPIPEGPLHHLNLGREIARSFSYVPVMPMARSAAGAVATGIGGKGSGVSHVTINLHYNVNGATPAGFDARSNAEQIVKIVRDAMHREARLRFATA